MYVWWPLRINFCTWAIFLKFTIRVENICTRNVSLQLPLVLEGANLVLEGANFRCVRRWGLGRTIRACSVWSRPMWPHRAQYITIFFYFISLYTMLDWNSNRIYLTDVNLTFPFAASELMWYRGGEWYLRVQRGRGQSQGWHPNQGPRKGGKYKISIWLYINIQIMEVFPHPITSQPYIVS